MGKHLLEKIYWREPPALTKMLYFEKREPGVTLRCHILSGKDFASVRGIQEGMRTFICCRENSERTAIEYVRQRGYLPVDE
jgi:hypothetical protein